MSRSAESFSRGKPKFKQQPKLLVICEDSKSSLIYLEDAANHFRVDVKVKIAHLGVTDPLNIVTKGLAQVNKYDHVYCVIDRDNHANFDAAITQSQTSAKLTVITSYPCFEYWLLLHFFYTRKPYTAVGGVSAGASLVKDLKKYELMKNYDKGRVANIFSVLLDEDRFNIARKRAARILKEVTIDGVVNSSTQLHLLLDELEKLVEPQVI